MLPKAKLWFTSHTETWQRQQNFLPITWAKKKQLRICHLFTFCKFVNFYYIKVKERIKTGSASSF